MLFWTMADYFSLDHSKFSDPWYIVLILYQGKFIFGPWKIIFCTMGKLYLDHRKFIFCTMINLFVRPWSIIFMYRMYVWQTYVQTYI